MISTVIDQSLGLEFPIFQGGMAWVADASLAAGVSNAGGLGIIAAMNSNGEQLREEIRKCKTMTDKIFGVNIMLMSPFAEEVSDVVVEEGIKVITTGAGNPGKYMAKWLEAGIKVIPVVPSVALARKMEKDGAFAVIAEGGESGGRCSGDSGDRRRWYCRWQRGCRSIYARRSGRSGRHKISCCKGMYYLSGI